VEFEHEFTVPVGVDQAWRTLLDVERVAPCMPGATLDSVKGDDMVGTVKVKVGPIMMTYHGTARFEEKDEQEHRVVLTASGRETRGTGTARATVRSQLHDEGDHTRVVVATSLAVTGRPAQFGRGVMQEVGGKLVGQFAQALATQVMGGPSAEAAPSAVPPAAAGPAAAAGAAEVTEAPVGGPVPTPPTPPAAEAPAPGPAEPAAARPQEAPAPRAAPPRPSPEAIDLIGTAGGPVLRRLLPAVGIVIVVGLIIWWLARR
jgi:carbon monoxide dehydrogenase subunit G